MIFLEQGFQIVYHSRDKLALEFCYTCQTKIKILSERGSLKILGALISKKKSELTSGTVWRYTKKLSGKKYSSHISWTKLTSSYAQRCLFWRTEKGKTMAGRKPVVCVSLWFCFCSSEKAEYIIRRWKKQSFLLHHMKETDFLLHTTVGVVNISSLVCN